MRKNLIIDGLPQSIAMDAWWLASETTTSAQSRHPSTKTPDTNAPKWRSYSLGGLLFLVLLGDFLFWGYRTGFTLALFAVAIFGVVAMQEGNKSGQLKPALLMLLTILPVIEHVQALSVSLLIGGTIIAVSWLRVPREGGIEWIISGAMKLIAFVPSAGALALIGTLSELRGSTQTARMVTDLRMGKVWQNWAFPVGGALVLGGLLMAANPVLEQSVAQFFQADVDIIALVRRCVFWFGLGLLIWPLINPPKPQSPVSLLLPVLSRNIGLNAGSVLRALVVFNVFLAVQSLLDVSILFGGAALPDDMSYATYAHRGAYPLLVTAMLAGLFTFAARPYLRDNAMLKPLLLLWVGQNVLLTLSAALRLDLYIAEYGLTYLRIYALIWMGLVAIGLLIVLWHVLRERSSLVLVTRLAALGLGTLYICAFVNFASLIATNTVNRAADPTVLGTVDWDYLCDLGPTAAKAVVKGLVAHPTVRVPSVVRRCIARTHVPTNWREFDLRTLRTYRYLPTLWLR